MNGLGPTAKDLTIATVALLPGSPRGGPCARDRSGAGEMLPNYLTQGELAERWRITTRTLSRWRVAVRSRGGCGLTVASSTPGETVLAYEQAQLRRP